MKRIALAIGVVGIAASGAEGAKPPAPAADLPPLYSAVIDCLTVADRDARLACFEEAATRLKAATQSGDIVVVDRDQIKKTKRTLFGLPLPRIDILGGGSDADEVKQVDGVIASAHRDGDGRWVIRLQDGATWQQIDDRPVAREPRSGFTVQIVRASMGTFMMRIQNQPGVRVKRLS